VDINGSSQLFRDFPALVLSMLRPHRPFTGTLSVLFPTRAGLVYFLSAGSWQSPLGEQRRPSANAPTTTGLGGGLLAGTTRSRKLGGPKSNPPNRTPTCCPPPWRPYGDEERPMGLLIFKSMEQGPNRPHQRAQISTKESETTAIPGATKTKPLQNPLLPFYSPGCQVLGPSSVRVRAFPFPFPAT